MPRKLRELRADLRKSGFVLARQKGSHQAWHCSLRDDEWSHMVEETSNHVQTDEEEIVGGPQDGEHVQRRVVKPTTERVRRELTVESRTGDPRFLEVIGRSNGRVIDLLGLAEPVRVNLDGEATVDVEPMADPEWLGGFIEALGRVRHGAERSPLTATVAPSVRPRMLSLEPDDTAMVDAGIGGG